MTNESSILANHRMDTQAIPLISAAEFSIFNAQHVLFALKQYKTLGIIRALDFYQAQFIYNTSAAFVGVAEDKKTDDAVNGLPILLAAILSKQVGDGHVCINLSTFLEHPSRFINTDKHNESPLLLSAALLTEQLSSISVASCIEILLNNNAIVHAPEAIHNLSSNAAAPMVIKGERLYLQRFFAYESTIASNIQARLGNITDFENPDSLHNITLTKALSVLFDYQNATDELHAMSQKVACALAARSRFAVITGGPGTGKTTTVVKLLGALQAIAGEDSAMQGAKYRIGLAAPTGKAAARLNQSINEKVDELPLNKLPGNVSKQDIPVKVRTIHQLLGSQFNSRQFIHNAKVPLPLDILVIDEASMVDVDLMSSVFQALAPHARLILLGDKDQLASVDAGAVLGDLAKDANHRNYSQKTVAWIAQVAQVEPENLQKFVTQQQTLLAQNIAMLDYSYRFDQNSGIKQLADVVNGMNANVTTGGDVIAQFKQNQLVDCKWLYKEISALAIGNSEFRLSQAFIQHAETGSAHQFHEGGQSRSINGRSIAPPEGYSSFLTILNTHKLTQHSCDKDWNSLAQTVLKAFDKFRILCAMREGAWGTQNINRVIERSLIGPLAKGALDGWYQGRPVLMTKNDYNLGLMNGDIGIAMQAYSAQSPNPFPLKVAFSATDGSQSIRWFSVNRLHDVQTAFAMTVHKSQGSEFAHACLVLPENMNPVLTKELVYTAITRSKSWFSLVTPNHKIFYQSIAINIDRDSGLRVDL